MLANDCLASLPPVTFFEDAVVEESGEHTTVFRLEHSALRPLVDVGRVFGMATGRSLGTSTLERLRVRPPLLPEHEAVFREASDTFRILLWQQARIGIGQGTDGHRAAAGAPQPPRSARAEGRLPLHPAARSSSPATPPGSQTA